MFTPMRRSLGMTLGVLALLGPLSQKSQAQCAMNPYVNPLAAQMMFPGNAAVLQTQAMLNSPLAYGAGFAGLGGIYGGGIGYGGLFPGAALGYGSLLNGGIGGYGGGLIGTALTGAALGYGYGMGMGMYGTQWMMNPYQGYLKGASSLTRANAEYQKTIQQAKLDRQEAIRSSIETRRAMIEEAEWEREHMPDPEKIRQQAMERELTRARSSPPLNDIWNARALNALLRHLITQLGEGASGRKVPLSDDIVKHINPTSGITRGNVGLLRDGGNLEWPETLQGERFQKTRERISALIKEAYKSVDAGNLPSSATLNDLQDTINKMQDSLDGNVGRFTPDDYFEAKRYLDQIKGTFTALKDPNIVNQFNGNWAFKGNNVAELVRHMREKGLMFAPATPKDEAAYVALYYALASFDASLSRYVSSGRIPEKRDNK